MVCHEYTHGLSERLVTDAEGFGALIGAQPGAISEGPATATRWTAWSRIPAWPDRRAQAARCASASTSTTRTPAAPSAPALDCAVRRPDAAVRARGRGCRTSGGYRYGDFGEIDNGGPRCTPTARSGGDALVDPVRRWSPSTAAGGPGAGAAYITGALRLVPEDPSFLDMRNAIVQAAWTQHGATTGRRLWNVFADRGMGWCGLHESTGRHVAGAELRPDPDAPTPVSRGPVTGRVIAEDDAPVAGATVAVAGHDSGPRRDPALLAHRRRTAATRSPASRSAQTGPLRVEGRVRAADHRAERRGRRHDREGLQPVPARLGRRFTSDGSGHHRRARTSRGAAAARPRRSTTTRTRSGARPRATGPPTS